jgi:hypothetical protein
MPGGSNRCHKSLAIGEDERNRPFMLWGDTFDAAKEQRKDRFGLKTKKRLTVAQERH